MANQWGIYTSRGKSIFDIDSLVDIHQDFKAKVSNFPVENGGFYSYNKVQEPLKSKVKLSVSGKTRINKLINQLNTQRISPTTLTIITPMFVYKNMTIEGFSYQQTAASGVDLLMVTISLVEVRIVSTGKYTTINVSDPNNSATVATGQAQAHDINSKPPLLWDNREALNWKRDHTTEPWSKCPFPISWTLPSQNAQAKG